MKYFALGKFLSGLSVCESMRERTNYFASNLRGPSISIFLSYCGSTGEKILIAYPLQLLEQLFYPLQLLSNILYKIGVYYSDRRFMRAGNTK